MNDRSFKLLKRNYYVAEDCIKSVRKPARFNAEMPFKPKPFPLRPSIGDPHATARVPAEPAPSPLSAEPPSRGLAAHGLLPRFSARKAAARSWKAAFCKPQAQTPSRQLRAYIFVAAPVGNIHFFFNWARGVGGCKPKPQPPLPFLSLPSTSRPPGQAAAGLGRAARSLHRVITHLLIPPACSCSKPP